MKINDGTGLLTELGNSAAMNQRINSKVQGLEEGLKNSQNIRGKEGIDLAAKGFESMFMLQMLQSMRKTIPENGMFGNSQAEKIFNSMLDEKMSDKISESGTFGLSNMISEYLGKKYGIEESSNLKNDLNTIISENSVPKFDKNLPVKKMDNSMSGKVGQYNNIIYKAAVDLEMDPDLLKAVIAKESSGNTMAVSSHGAKGLMQLMDGTAQELGVKDPFDPSENITAGARYLKKQLIANDGDLKKALAAYNAGPSAVKLYNGVPPYKETQNYVNKVIELQHKFRAGEI